MESPANSGCPTAGTSACPFLRAVSLSTDFSFLSCAPERASPPASDRRHRGPIFADDSNFDFAFRLFHGHGGVVPLASSGDSARLPQGPRSLDSASDHSSKTLSLFVPQNPGGGGPDVWEVDAEGSSLGSSSTSGSSLPARLAEAPLASLGLSAFGGGGPFGFDAFRDALEARKERERREAEERRREEQRREREDQHSHESLDEDWLATGKCPIARSYRVLRSVIPAASAAFKLPAGVKYTCPPAIVALRAAVSSTSLMKTLRPQALPIRVLAIGTMGLFLNIPLGAWREHLEKFSPQWILVVHASVPFVAVLRKAALMPKYAMAFTVAASILGQAVGSRMERRRLASSSAPGNGATESGAGKGLLKPRERRPKARELGAGLRGLGFGNRESVLAYDCDLVAPPSAPSHLASGHRQGEVLACDSGLVTPVLPALA